MLFSSWLRNYKHSLGCRSSWNQTRRRKSPVRRVAPRPRLEVLEDRTLLSAYIVTTTADSGAGSLRDAINQINADTSHALYASSSNPNVDEIDFNITGASDTGGGFNPTTGVATISPSSALPAITNAVIINGHQGQSSAQGPVIVLDGSQSGFGNGLEVNADNVMIEGLDIINWSDGILIHAVNSTQVQDNFIGIEADGKSAAGNGNGVQVDTGATGVVIGGLGFSGESSQGESQGQGNVISADQANGILTESDITVTGNRIGTTFDGEKPPVDSNGNPVYQGSGLLVESSGADSTVIGAAGAGMGNLISGNDFGMQIENTSRITVQNNMIGTTDSGVGSLPNKADGVYIASASNISIGNNLLNAATQSDVLGNVIGFNGGDGVSIDSASSQVSVLENSIKANVNLGIELQKGANNNQPAPILNSASRPQGGTLTISGSLTAVANTTYRVEFFANSPGSSPQGQIFLVGKSLTTNAAGTAVFTFTVNVPSNLGTVNITATATEPNNNTSQFSNAVLAPPPPPEVVAAMIPGYGVYLYNNNSNVEPQGWHQLTPAWVQSIAVSEFGNGIGVVATISGYGTYLYSSGGGWSQISPVAASIVAVDGPYVVGEFPGYGVHLYNLSTGGWTLLSPVDASALAISPSGVVVGDFYYYGVHEFTPSTGGWAQLSPAFASQLCIDANGDVLGEFPGYGVHLHQPGSGWNMLTPLDATSIAMNDSGMIAASFSPWGTYLDGNGGWKQISTAVADQVTVDLDGNVVGEFSGYGIHFYDSDTGEWSQLTPVVAGLISTGKHVG